VQEIIRKLATLHEIEWLHQPAFLKTVFDERRAPQRDTIASYRSPVSRSRIVDLNAAIAIDDAVAFGFLQPRLPSWKVARRLHRDVMNQQVMLEIGGHLQSMLAARKRRTAYREELIA
jgi:hypothetical protein